MRWKRGTDAGRARPSPSRTDMTMATGAVFLPLAVGGSRWPRGRPGRDQEGLRRVKGSKRASLTEIAQVGRSRGLQISGSGHWLNTPSHLLELRFWKEFCKPEQGPVQLLDALSCQRPTDPVHMQIGERHQLPNRALSRPSRPLAPASEAAQRTVASRSRGATRIGRFYSSRGWSGRCFFIRRRLPPNTGQSGPLCPKAVCQQGRQIAQGLPSVVQRALCVFASPERRPVGNLHACRVAEREPEAIVVGGIVGAIVVERLQVGEAVEVVVENVEANRASQIGASHVHQENLRRVPRHHAGQAQKHMRRKKAPIRPRRSGQLTTRFFETPHELAIRRDDDGARLAFSPRRARHHDSSRNPVLPISDIIQTWRSA